jgi:hypothetical protein
MRTEGLGRLKISKDLTMNRTRYFRSCGAVSQPIVPQRDIIIFTEVSPDQIECEVYRTVHQVTPGKLDVYANRFHKILQLINACCSV